MKYFNLFKACFVFSMLLFAQQMHADSKVLWHIGEHDGSTKGFALAPAGYKDYVTSDFGYEDRFFIIGLSNPASEFPYVMPGPSDAWGGTGPTSGVRTQVMNIVFRTKNTSASETYHLLLDILDCSDIAPPLLKVIINGKAFLYPLPAGGGEASLLGDNAKSIKHRIRIPLTNDLLRKGSNQLTITSIEGSWMLFDQLRIEGDGSIQLQEENPNAYLFEVKAANYQLKNAQPLLVDALHLKGTPSIRVELDGETILEQNLELGRYLLEAPMPLVTERKESSYTVWIDGKKMEQGKVTRSPQQMRTPADYVDTRLGTAHSRWMIAPGPWMPFGMVKISPDNQNRGWQAGYDPHIESIGTFSHIHEWTMGGLGIMPTSGSLKTRVGDESSLHKDEKSYRSAFDKSTEVAKIGYYKVDLTDYGIQAEITATTRCSFQRYTYPKGTPARVMIDLQIPCEYDYDLKEISLRQVGPRRVEGFSKQESKNVWSNDADQKYTVYFSIEFDQDIKQFGGWTNEQLSEQLSIEGKDLKRAGCYVEFDTNRDSVIQVRTGISYVDLDGARRNLKTEISDRFHWSFDAVSTAQVDTWNDIFQRIEVTSNNQREKMRFYTNLYRAHCRNIFSDVDGRWVDGVRNETKQFKSPDEVALGCDAFWNTFWNLNQLWNLVTPEWSSRWVKSQLAMYDANGWLAKGPAGMNYIPVMVAEHEIPLLVGAYQLGIRDYDVDKMYEAVRKMQMTPSQKVGNGYAGNRDLLSYMKHHFVASDEGRSSNGLEYSYDDWCVGQLAKSLGKTADYQLFDDRGSWWRNSIDTSIGYARMRNSKGIWEPNFDPIKTGANHHFVEGNAWQLTFFVPQDVPGLANYIGKEQFIKRLTWGFETSELLRYNAPGDQYWDCPVAQGNQQSMHFAYLFNYVGQPWQTQHWVRSIMNRYYGYEPANAYLGDEDQGQMSAWFVMAAIGLFQMDGGCSSTPTYQIGSPIFEKIRIDLGERYGRGKEFVISANNVSPKNHYIQSAKLNGKPLDSFYFPAERLLDGGRLELEMGDKPNKKWGLMSYGN